MDSILFRVEMLPNETMPTTVIDAPKFSALTTACHGKSIV